MALAQSGSPFDTGFTSLQTLFTGTIAKVASLITIVIGGYQFAHGEPGAKKTLAGVAAGTGIAVLAAKVLSWPLGHLIVGISERQLLSLDSAKVGTTKTAELRRGSSKGLYGGSFMRNATTPRSIPAASPTAKFTVSSADSQGDARSEPPAMYNILLALESVHRMLTVREVAELLQRSHFSIYRMAQRRQIPSLMIGGTRQKQRRKGGRAKNARRRRDS